MLGARGDLVAGNVGPFTSFCKSGFVSLDDFNELKQKKLYSCIHRNLIRRIINAAIFEIGRCNLEIA
jgi:hypothetical protein